MTRRDYAIGGLAVLVIGFYIFQSFRYSRTNSVEFFVQYSVSLEREVLTIGDVPVHVELAQTNTERMKGLMGRSELADGTGMLFIFPDAQPLVFWNKDTHIALDIIWIHDETIVGTSSLPRVEERGIVQVGSPKSANYVLEVPSGFAGQHHVVVGMKVARSK